MQKELQTLQDFVTSDFAGIIWFTNEALNKKPTYFAAFDYLFDGLLLKKINSPLEISSKFQTFFTKHFDQDFILVHSDISDENWQSNTQKFVDYFKVVNIDKRKLGVVNLTDNKLTEYLQKKYPANLVVELKV